MDNVEIGKYLLKLRKEKSLTQNELALKLGVTYQAVSRWENGDSIPDIDSLGNIADFYNISIDDILQRTQSKEEDKQQLVTSKGNSGKLAFSLFVSGNMLGLLSVVLISIYASLINAGLFRDILFFMAFLLLAIFILGSHLYLNIHFFVYSSKSKEEVNWFIKSYRAFFILLIIFIYRLLNIPVLLIVVLLLRLIEHGIQKSYLNDTRYFIQKQIPKNHFHKIVLVLSLILLLSTTFYEPILGSYTMTSIIPMIYFTYISYKALK